MTTPITVKYDEAKLREIIAGVSGCEPDKVRLHADDFGEKTSMSAEADTTLDALNKAKRKRARKAKDAGE